MPIYKYKCTSPAKLVIDDEHTVTVTGLDGTWKCDTEFEVFYTSQSKVAEEEPLEACPRCGGTEKERLINTGTSHILKGRGWYRDGY